MQGQCVLSMLSMLRKLLVPPLALTQDLGGLCPCSCMQHQVPMGGCVAVQGHASQTHHLNTEQTVSQHAPRSTL